MAKSIGTGRSADNTLKSVFSIDQQYKFKKDNSWSELNDPYFSNVVLLLHFDGTNNSSIFTDSSSKNRSITRYGNTIITTTQSKFNGSSCYFANAGDYLSMSDSDDWYFGTGDFTIEFFMNSPPGGNGSWDLILGQYRSDGYVTPEGPVAVGRNTSNNSVNMSIYSGIYDPNTGNHYKSIFGTKPAYDNQWHHIAIVRYGSIFKLYIDGVSQGTPITMSSDFACTNSTTQFCIGRAGDYNGGYYKGCLDELRITKGIARYTTTEFIPTTAPFPNF